VLLVVVVVVGRPVVFAVVVTGAGTVKPTDNPLDPRILLSSTPPPGELVCGTCTTGEGVGLLILVWVGVAPRSLSLKYFARLRRDLARVGSFSEAALLAFCNTSERSWPTDEAPGDEVEGLFKRCVKMPPLSAPRSLKPLWKPWPLTSVMRPKDCGGVTAELLLTLSAFSALGDELPLEL